jgi:hypothetical protein
VAENNALALKSGKALVEASKKHPQSHGIPDSKLTATQKRAFELNELILLLHSSKKQDQIESKLKQLQDKYPYEPLLELIPVAMTFNTEKKKNSKKNSSIGPLKDLVQSNPSSLVYGLLLVQCQMQSKSWTEALKSLQNLLDALKEESVKYSSGLVSLLEFLHVKVKKASQAWFDYLTQAEHYWASYQSYSVIHCEIALEFQILIISTRNYSHNISLC